MIAVVLSRPRGEQRLVHLQRTYATWGKAVCGEQATKRNGFGFYRVQLAATCSRCLYMAAQG